MYKTQKLKRKTKKLICITVMSVCGLYVCKYACICSTNLIPSSFRHIKKKIAYSASNRICPSQVPFMFASTKREQKQANNQPLCQFATLKAFPFP